MHDCQEKVIIQGMSYRCGNVTMRIEKVIFRKKKNYMKGKRYGSIDYMMDGTVELRSFKKHF